MKMMMAFRWVSTPITPIVKSAAVSASDSASTDRSPSSEHNRAGNRNEQQHTGELEGQQVLVEQGLRNHADRVELLQLAFVVSRRNDQRRRQATARDHHDFREQNQANTPAASFHHFPRAWASSDGDPRLSSMMTNTNTTMIAPA